MQEFLSVDPRMLRLPPSRSEDADPVKLQRQIVKYADSTAGMPAILAYRGKDGVLMIVDGVTRATRVAMKVRDFVRVEVIGELETECGHLPTVGDRLP